MYPIPPSEKLVETRTCKQCGTDFPITDKDVEFLERLSPTIAGISIPIPIPTMCPECRKFQRLAWRNEKKIFKRKCDATWKDIIAMFPPDSPFVIYDENVWKTDIWDAKEYGCDFDFERPFFEQLSELALKVPIASKSSVFCENSDYCNACTGLKDCYLCFSANRSENTLYSVDIVNANSCVDCLGVLDCENCYECTVATACYNVRNSYDVQDCRDSRFLLSCNGCSDCYGCFGLTNAQFFIFNTPYSKEDYFKMLSELTLLSFAEQRRRFETFCTGKYEKKPLRNEGSENVVESENVFNSKNVSFSRNVRGSEDIRHSQKMQVPPVRLAMDYTGFGNQAEKIYYSQQIGNNASNILFCFGTFSTVSNTIYSINCRDGVDSCFGCVGLRGGVSYCILNKQYSRDEYEALVLRIIEHMKKTGEWGEFFPANMSPHGYDNSICQVISPLTEKEALQKGYAWSGYEVPFPKMEKIIPAVKLPDDITQIPDDILNWAVECEITGKPFRIVKQELEFYRKNNLPIPKKHPDRRYAERFAWFNNY